MEYLVDRHLLPNNKLLRRKFLDEYFSLDLIGFEELIGEHWKLTTFTPDSPEFYVDPLLEKNLKDWFEPVSISEIGLYKRFYKNCMISFVDSWSLYFWSLILKFHGSTLESNTNFTLFHVDDHKDHDTPLMHHSDGKYYSILSQNLIDIFNPESVALIIKEKGISMGSFISLLIHEVENIDILHLKYSTKKRVNEFYLDTILTEDPLLMPGVKRPSLQLRDHELLTPDMPPSPHHYSISFDPEELVKKIKPESIIFLHIDCDAFNNRYNGTSHWNPLSSSIDLDLSAIKRKVERLFKLISQTTDKIYLNIALSPAFFPSEYWKEILVYMLSKGDEYGIIKNDDLSLYLKNMHPNEMLNVFHS